MHHLCPSALDQLVRIAIVKYVVWATSRTSVMSPFLAAQTLDQRVPGFAVGIWLAAKNSLCVIDGGGFALLLKPRWSRSRLRCGLGRLRLLTLLAT